MAGALDHTIGIIPWRWLRSMACIFAATATALLSMIADLKAAKSCAKSDFEQVVDQAALALGTLNAKRRPVFQNRLRQLKAKRRWSHAEFIKQGTSLVQNERISQFNEKIGELLAKITSKGEQGAAAPKPDCKLLLELQGTMKSLVQVQTKKWDFMFRQLDKALKQ